jgi:hypothetical protein
VKKTTLLTLAVLCRLLTDGQQKVFDLPMTPADAKDIQIFATPDSQSRAMCLSLASRHIIRQYLLPADSSAGDPVNLDSIYYNYKESQYLTAVMLPDGIETCLASRHSSMLRFIRTDSRQRSRQSDSIVFPPGQQLFSAFYQQGLFYALAVQTGSDILLIYRRRGPGEVDILQKEAPVRDWGKKWFRLTSTHRHRIDDLESLTASIGMIQQDTSTPPPRAAVLAKTKLYIRTGLVYLSFDNTQLVTHVLEIPLDQRPCRILSFDPEDWYHKEIHPGFSNGNSYILDSTLIVAAIIYHQPYLGFYDLHTGRLKQAYTPNEKGNTSFPRSPIWQTGDFWNKDKVHPITMEQFAANSFDFWSLGVRARQTGNQHIEVEIGTIYNRESFGKMMLILAEATPAFFGMGALIITGPASIKTTFFYSQFDNSAYTAQSYKELADKSELINTFANSQKISDKWMSGFQHGTNYWLAWYDADQQQFFIYKF